MHIEPAYTSIGKLFEYRPIFYIPKYQRAYAWDAESISDFLRDLMSCFDMRKAEKQLYHFFGGILSVEKPVQGVARQHKYEIIDGQQRIVTFTLLVVSIIEAYKKLRQEAQAAGDTRNEAIIDDRIKDLSERFIVFNQEIHREIKTVEVLKPSKADQPFYRELIRGGNPAAQRDSHCRIEYAKKALTECINNIVAGHPSIEPKIDDLEVIQTIIEQDFTVLHMVTQTRDEAYRLFQVINDRGTNLTDGDLLRAKTLEILEGHDQEQEIIESAWDDMLKDPPSRTNDYLNWIYESHVGNRPKANALFDMFCNQFFPQHEQHRQLGLNVHDAQEVRVKVKEVQEDIDKCRKLINGDWLHEKRRPVNSWDHERLNILMVDLGHSLSIPLFLAASALDHRLFSEIVQTVERTFFRYKLICNQHVTPLKNIYYQESLAIRNDPASYNVNSLKTKLQRLIDTKAQDEQFKNGLKALQYQESGGGNKPLKYFLMTIEYYYQWFKDGARGAPSCFDKSRVFAFSGTSIEHIYPRKADPSDIETDLEEVKNTIGNLTIMDPGQNTLGGNEVFINKKNIYVQTAVEITKQIGMKQAWTLADIEEHRDFLLDAAVAVFRP